MDFTVTQNFNFIIFSLRKATIYLIVGLWQEARWLSKEIIFLLLKHHKLNQICKHLKYNNNNVEALNYLYEII